MSTELLEFIAKIVDSLVWPGVVIVLLILGRREIRRILLSLQRLKFKEFEAEFSERVEQLEMRAEEALPGVEVLPSTSETRDPLDDLLEISPRVAAVEAFRFVEEAARRAGERHNLPDGRFRGVRNSIRELVNRGVITSEARALFNDLRVTRNQLAHESSAELSPKDARQFINAARLLAESLNRL